MDKIPNRNSKSMGILKKLKYFLPLNAKVLIYFDIISYKLLYSSLGLS